MPSYRQAENASLPSIKEGANNNNTNCEVAMQEDRKHESKGFFKYINKRYAIALSVIALFLVARQLMVQFLISDMRGDVYVINISGKQLTLTQKIAKSAMGILNARTEAERVIYAIELYESKNLLQQEHNVLRVHARQSGAPWNSHKEIDALYEKLEPYYQEIVRAAGALMLLNAEKADYSAVDLHVKTILNNESDFHEGMAQIVALYESRAEIEFLVLQTLEFSILLLLLVVLIIEWRVVFKPAQQEINESFEHIQEREAQLNQLFEISPAITILFDAETLRVVKYSDAAVRLIREWLHIELGEETTFADIMQGDEDAGLADRLLERIRDEKSFANMEVGICPGRVAMLSVETMELQGRVLYLAGFFDITAYKQMVTFDSMTNMMNRRSGMELLTWLFEEDAVKGRDFAICFIDIDRLKMVNDQYGHQEGDFYIQAVAQAIRDIVGERYRSIRYGGDEIIVLAESDETCDFEHRIAMVSDRLDVIRRKHMRPYPMSISYGFAWYSHGKSLTLSELIEEADINMYEQKKQKRAARKSETGMAPHSTQPLLEGAYDSFLPNPEDGYPAGPGNGRFR